jgi:hypothetical protein
MATRTMNPALLTCIAMSAILFAQTSRSADIGRPELTATLEKTTEPAIEPGRVSSFTEAEAPQAAPSQDQPPPRGNPLWAIPVRGLAATRDRPLFSASRRPPSPIVPSAPDTATRPAPAAIKVAPLERPTLVLLGTIVSANTRIAVVLNQTTNLVTRVREGEQEAGWRMMTVSLRSTIMERDDQFITLNLPPLKEEPAPTGMVSQISVPLNRRNMH